MLNPFLKTFLVCIRMYYCHLSVLFCTWEISWIYVVLSKVYKWQNLNCLQSTNLGFMYICRYAYNHCMYIKCIVNLSSQNKYHLVKWLHWFTVDIVWKCDFYNRKLKSINWTTRFRVFRNLHCLSLPACTLLYLL